MRVLIANWHRNVEGGAEKYLQALMPALVARGHQVSIVYERPVSPERETIDAACSPLKSWNVGELGLPAALQAAGQWRPDVVYCHGLESGELETALQRRYPSVLFAHNYYGTCGTGSKCHSFPQARPCSRRFGPLCVLLHYSRRCGGLNPQTTWSLFRRQAERLRGLPAYRAIVVASAHMCQEFLQHGLAAQKVHCLPLPASDVIRQPEPPMARAPQGRILLIGRLTNLKGGGYLIQAIQKASEKLGDLSLTIAGDGPEREYLQQLVEKLRIRAKFVGWVGTSAKLELLAQSDLLAMPSLWPEPFGLGGIEAGSRGVPSVGFAVGGIPDWLIPGYSGELASGDPPSVNGLAEAIVRALADPAHYSRLCRGAWEVASRFTMGAHLDKLEPILAGEGATAPPIHSICSGVQPIQ